MYLFIFRVDGIEIDRLNSIARPLVIPPSLCFSAPLVFTLAHSLTSVGAARGLTPAPTLMNGQAPLAHPVGNKLKGSAQHYKVCGLSKLAGEVVCY